MAWHGRNRDISHGATTYTTVVLWIKGCIIIFDYLVFLIFI